MKTLLKDLFGACFLIFCSTLSFGQNLLAEVQPNTSCGAPNGSVSASVDGQTLDYSFQWYAGPDETGELLSTQPVVTNLGGGTYTVTATHNSTAVVLGPLSVNVMNNPVMPVVSVEVLTPLTSCFISDGSLKAVVTGAADDYTYAWYHGTVPGGGLPVLATTQILSHVYNVTYTVVVTHNVSGCQSIASGAVPDERIIPAGATVVQLSPLTSCVSSNGSLKAVVPEPASDYYFKWYKGPQVALPVVSQSQTANNLSSGSYTVDIRHKASHCPVYVTGYVSDSRIKPTGTINVVSHYTSCTAPNGNLSAVVSGSPADYTFAWYQGSALSGPVLSTNQTLTQLSAGTYSVVVRHNVSQCQAIGSAAVQDKRALFSASVQVVSNSTSCTAPNGSLRAVPATGSSSSYTYKWYKGTVPEGTPLSTSQTYSQLSPGVYTVVLRHKTSLCETTVSGTVQDKSMMGNIYVEVLQPLYSCTVPGALRVMPLELANDYAYEWYEGAAPGGPLVSTSQIYWAESPGPKTVVVTRKATPQCKTVITGILPDERPLPQVSVNVISNETTCAPANGSLTAVVAQGQPEDYSYFWFSGTTTDGPVLSGNDTISQLSAGMYTVLVVDNNSQCQSVVSAAIQDQKPVMEVSVNVVSNDTSCGVMPNGVLQAVAAGPSYEYTFEWYEGTSVSGPVIFMGPVAFNLTAGTYTVVATNNISQCQAVVSAMVQEVFTPVVGDIEVISNNTSCTVPDGSLKAVVWGGNPADYTYEWYEGLVVFSGPVLSVSDELHNVPGGTYTVLITRKHSNCMAIVSGSILDECQDLMSRSGDTASLEAEQDAQLSYYPNPTTGTLWIKGGSTAGYIVLSDRNGNVIRRQNLSPSGEALAIDLHDQLAGIYVLTFHSGVSTSSYQIMKK